MKKKLFFSALILTLAIAIAILLIMWPLSFSSVISDEAELRVVIVDINNEVLYENGQVNQSTREYTFSPDSTEFAQIQQILSRHSSHSRLWAFSDNNLLLGDRYLELHSGENRITFGGINEIKVDGANHNRVYRIGYSGNDTALAMMDEIKNALDASEPTWECNMGVSPGGSTYR